MKTFSVGDIAIFMHPGAGPAGHLVTIIEPLAPRPVYGTDDPVPVYIVDPGFPTERPGSLGWGARPKDLKPLPGDEELGSWDDCVFKPKELEHVTNET